MQCLIIDDNPKTSQSLTRLLEALPVVTQIDKAVQPYLVRSLMAAENIDTVFIRVRLWDFRQFEKLEKMPVVVFLTGGKDKLTGKPETGAQYALREPYQAIDLVQLVTAIERDRYTEPPDYFFMRYDGRFHRIYFRDIELIERKKFSYVQFYIKESNLLVPGTLTGWLSRLPSEKFTRVSDTLVVPVSELSKINSDVYEYKGRKIRLTFRFAGAARKEIENWPEGL